MQICPVFAGPIIFCRRKTLVQYGNSFGSMLKEIILSLSVTQWLHKMLKLLILLRSDALLHRDTFDMMHQYSWSLYHHISIMKWSLGFMQNNISRLPSTSNQIGFLKASRCTEQWGSENIFITNFQVTKFKMLVSRLYILIFLEIAT